MPLLIKINAKEDKQKIVVYDCTGKYLYDNKGGWGKPNLTLQMVESAVFEVYPPEVTIPVIVPIFPEFPTDETDVGYELPIDLFGMKAIESGVWRIGMRVKGKDANAVAFEKYSEIREVFTETAECCVDKLNAMTTNVPVNLFTKDDKRKAAAELSLLMFDALTAKKCGNYNAAQDILKYINLQCQCCG